MFKTALSVAIIGLFAAGASPASSSEDSQENTLDRVTVTAQKREQEAQDVPISVTAFSETDIDRLGIDEFVDYATRSPNVGFSQQGNRAFTRMGIRGVTNVGGRANAVGIYLDEFNIAPNILVAGWSRTLDTPLYDIERIEVLRGPQGTYFGRNTLGGAINITSRKPTPQSYFGNLRGEIDEHGTWLGRVSGNIPLGERSALRLTGYYRDVGGWMTNLADGGTNDGRDQGLRTAFRYDDGERLTVDLSLSRTEERQNQLEYVATGILAPVPAQLVEVVDNFHLLFGAFGTPPIDINQFPQWPLPLVSQPLWPDTHDTFANDARRRSDSESDMFIGRINYRFDNALELTSVTGYLNNDFEQFGDGDASPLPGFTVARDSISKGWSQELRLSSFGRGRIDWTVGGIVARDEISETDISSHLAADPYLNAWGALLFSLGVQDGVVDLSDPQIQFLLANGLVPEVFGPMSVGNFEDTDRGIDTESYALFGDMTVEMTDALRLSVGLRWTRDEVKFTEINRPSITLPVGTDIVETSFSNLSPRLALNYRFGDDLSTYATISRGYKVGGVNSDVTTTDDGAVEQIYSEETAWNYELGFKGVIADNRIQLNAALFYIEWDDIQVRGQDVLSQRQFVQNATSANSKGGEIELVARLHSRLRWNLGYGYTDATFNNFPNAIPIDQVGFDTIDATGNRLPYAPEQTFNTGAEFSFAGPASTNGWLRADYRYTSRQFVEATNDTDRILGSFDLVNVRLGLDADRYGVALFVNNVFDEKYSLGTQGLETYYTGLQRSVGMPRTFGAVFNYSF
jgi:iron complex outermembrane receptor protein